MLISNWLKFVSRKLRQSSKRGQRRRRRVLPASATMETLEQRRLLSATVAPTAVNDVYSVHEGQTLEVPRGNVLDNHPTLQMGLTGRWTFDGNAVDESGRGHNLTEVHVGYAEGLSGQSLDLTGNTGSRFAIQPRDEQQFDFGSSDFTLQVWARFNHTNGEQVLAEKFHGASGPGWTLTKLADNRLHFYSAPSAVFSSSPLSISTHAWHQVVLRRSGDLFEIHFDGTVVAQHRDPDPIPDVGPGWLLFGRRNGFDGRAFAFDGRMDDAAIWSRALTDSELQDLRGYFGVRANDTSVDTASLSRGVIGRWAFDGNTLDNSGGSRHLDQVNVGFGPGLVGQSLDLTANSGSRFAIRPGDDQVFDFGHRDFTAQVWVNFSHTHGEQVLIEKFHGSQGPGWTLTKLPDNRLHFYAAPSGIVVSQPVSITVESWHQVVVRKSGSRFTIHFDGVVVGESSDPDPIPDVGPGWLLFGRRNGFDGRAMPFNGRMDEAVIWNRALSDSEVSTLQRNPSAISQSNQQFPVITTLVSGPTHGTVEMNADGTFRYEPHAGFVGTDRFQYRNTAGSSFSDGTVTINVNQQVLSRGLIGYWPFDGDGNDESVGTRDLEIVQAGFTQGLFDSALDLSGNAGHRFAIQPEDDHFFDIGHGDFTVQVWVNFNHTAGEQVIVEKFHGSSGPGWTLTKLPDNRLHFYSAPSAVLTSEPVPIKVGNWHQVVLRKHGTTFDVLLDGSVVATGSDTDPVPDSPGWLLFGRRTSLDGRVFALDGRMDDAAIWKRALADSEITDLLTDKSPVRIYVEAFDTWEGLTGLWRFDGDGRDESTARTDLDLVNATFGDGLIGEALDLSGTSGARFAIQPTDDPIYDFEHGDFTTQIWVNFNQTGGEQVLIEKLSGADGPGWSLTKLPDNRLHFFAAPSAVLTSEPVDVAPGVWHQIVMRKSDTRFDIFLDGTIVATTTDADAIPDSAGWLLIGRRNSHDGRVFAFDGRVDEAATWNRALNQSEIVSLWHGVIQTDVPVENRQRQAAVLSDGVLYVTGSESSEIITVRMSGDVISIDSATGPSDFFWAETSGIRRLSYMASSFPAEWVSRIEIDARGGNDIVRFMGNEADSIPVLVNGGSGNDDLQGRAGNDTLIGGEGNDRLTGFGGNDVLLGGNGKDVIRAGLGIDSVDGGRGSDTIHGGDGNDTLTGGEAADTVNGDAGNDVLFEPADSSSGNDWMGGGSGNDTIIGSHGEDTVLGHDGADLIRGDSGNDYLVGGNGHDTIQGGDGNDALIDRDSGNDVLDGGPGDDGMDAGPGDDTMLGGPGHDHLYGKRGNDTIFGDHSPEMQQSGERPPDLTAGNDLIVGGEGDDGLYGFGGGDTIRGESGSDTVIGGDHNDYLDGGDDDDVLHGDMGDDSIFGGNGHDYIFAGIGHDIAHGQHGSDYVDAGLGNDDVDGGGGGDDEEIDPDGGGFFDDLLSVGEWIVKTGAAIGASVLTAGTLAPAFVGALGLTGASATVAAATTTAIVSQGVNALVTGAGFDFASIATNAFTSFGGLLPSLPTEGVLGATATIGRSAVSAGAKSILSGQDFGALLAADLVSLGTSAGSAMLNEIGTLIPQLDVPVGPLGELVDLTRSSAESAIGAGIRGGNLRDTFTSEWLTGFSGIAETGTAGIGTYVPRFRGAGVLTELNQAVDLSFAAAASGVAAAVSGRDPASAFRLHLKNGMSEVAQSILRDDLDAFWKAHSDAVLTEINDVLEMELPDLSQPTVPQDASVENLEISASINADGSQGKPHDRVVHETIGDSVQAIPGGLTEREALRLSNAAYKFDADDHPLGVKELDTVVVPDESRWLVLKVHEKPSGLRAIVAEAEDGRYAVAFAGSDSFGDWLGTNVPQMLRRPDGTSVGYWSGQSTGGVPRRYEEALILVAEMQNRYGDRLRVTGHSLGGGLANYAGAMIGVCGVGFNSAPLGPAAVDEITSRGVPGATSQFVHYNNVEFVSQSPGQQLGTVATYQYPGERSPVGFWSNHSIGTIVTGRPFSEVTGPLAGSPYFRERIVHSEQVTRTSPREQLFPRGSRQ